MSETICEGVEGEGDDADVWTIDLDSQRRLWYGWSDTLLKLPDSQADRLAVARAIARIAALEDDDD